MNKSQIYSPRNLGLGFMVALVLVGFVVLPVNPDSPPATSTTTTLPVQTQGEEAPITCTGYGYYIPSEDRSVIGGRTYFRHDGVCRPESEINLASGDWTYLVVEGDTYYNLSRKGRTLRIPKKSWLNWHFGVDKITLDFQANSMTQLVDRSVYYNASCRYVKIGEAPMWKKLAKVNWHGDFGWEQHLSIYDSGTNATNPEFNVTYLNISYFDNSKAGFHVVNNNLYFLECDNSWFQDAVYPVTFKFNSYIINGSGGNATWDSGSHSDTVVKKATNEVQLDWEVNDWVSYWTLDENETTIYDENGTNNGTGQNLEVDDVVTGKYGLALALDGDASNERVDIASSSAFNCSSATITWRFNTSASAYVNGMYGIGPSQTDRFYCIVYNAAGYDNITVCQDDIGDAGLNAFGPTKVNDGDWHHFAVTINGSKVSMYLDGNPEGNVSSTNTFSDLASWKTYLGAYVIAGTNPGYEFDGTIDDYRFHCRQLTLSEINQSKDNEHKSTGNYTTVEVDAGSGKSVKNATITFTANGQTTDLWSNCSGSWTEHHTGITSGTNYDISGTEQNCSLMTQFTASNISKTPEMEKIEVWYGTTADSTEPSISAEAINDTEIEVNQSIKLNCTVSDDTAVDIVKFFIEPFGNITATDADPEFYIICNASNPCNTTTEGQYNWTRVWTNDTINNINSTTVTLNYTVVTTTTTTTTTTLPVALYVDRVGSIWEPVHSVDADGPIPATPRQLCRTDDNQLWSIWINYTASGYVRISNSSDNGTTWSMYTTTAGDPPDNIGIDCDHSTIVASYSTGSSCVIATSLDYGASWAYNSVAGAFGGASTYTDAQIDVWVKNNRTYILTMNATGEALIHFDAEHGGQSVDYMYYLNMSEDTNDGGTFYSTTDTTRMVVLWSEDTGDDNDTVLIIVLNDSGDMLQWKSTDNATSFGSKVKLYTDPTIDMSDNFWCNGFNQTVYCTGTDYGDGSSGDYCLYRSTDKGETWGAEDCHTPVWNIKGCLDSSNAFEKDTSDIFFVGACYNSSAFGQLIAVKWNGTWQTQMNLSDIFPGTSGLNRYYMPHAARYLDSHDHLEFIVSDDDDKNLTYMSKEVGITDTTTTTTIPNCDKNPTGQFIINETCIYSNEYRNAENVLLQNNAVLIFANNSWFNITGILEWLVGARTEFDNTSGYLRG